MFNKDFFTNNRKKLKESVGNDYPVILAGNFLMQRNSDISYKFRQDSTFWYFTGLNIPGLILVLSSKKDFIIVPKISDRRKIFEGTSNFDDIKITSGIDEVYFEEPGWELIDKIIKPANKVNTIKTQVSLDVIDEIAINPARAKMLARLHSSIEVIDIRKQVIKLRMVKQSEEIVAINNAIKVSSEAFNKIKARINIFENESDVESVINEVFAKNKLICAYESIVANGINGCTLHYIENNSNLDKNSLLLIDAGAEFNNYASDITRTYSLSKPTNRQIQVHQSVVNVQEFAFTLLRPGITIKDYEKQVENYMGEELLKLGLIKSVNKDNVRKYFPHATSHHLGLDTHDVADYEAELIENMVLTVEPGIYIAEEKIAIRIEDNVVLTHKGIDNLSKSLSRNL